jgi:hypothetical protein
VTPFNDVKVHAVGDVKTTVSSRLLVRLESQSKRDTIVREMK